MRIGRTLSPAAAPIYFKDIISGLKALVRGRQELKRFESELKEYFGVERCFLVSSGKAALTLILSALKDIYPDRNEVLIPAFTCYSVPSAIVRAGLKVKLCDIDPQTLDLDFVMLSKILNKPNNPMNPGDPTPRLLAIVPAHLFGLPADIERLRGLFSESEVPIIEDAAQTMGAERNGKKLGTLGDIGFFSLGRGKALSTVEGGIILTGREDIAENIMVRLSRVREYGIFELTRLFFKAISLALFLRPALFWIPKSIPFLGLGDTIYNPEFKIKKMSPFQVGLAKNWKKKLKRFSRARLEHSEHCSKLIKFSKSCQLSAVSDQFNPNLLRFPVIIHEDSLRDKILRESNERGLGIMPTYPDSIDGIPELAGDFQGRNFPAAKEHAKKLITLPIHPFVTDKDISKIGLLIPPPITS